MEASLSSKDETETLIGQSFVLNAQEDDVVSVLDMSLHDRGFTKTVTPKAVAPSSDVPRSVYRQVPSKGSLLDTSNRSFRPVLRSSLVLEEDDDILDDEAELSRLAESAALETFGVAAIRKDPPLRRSTLVSKDSSLDVSWFAKRGLMSRRSFEKYKKEMRESRRRMTMYDEGDNMKYLSKSLRKNEEFDFSKPVPRREPSMSNIGRELLQGDKHRIDENTDELKRLPVHKSRSLDRGLDYLVRSFVAALNHERAQDGESKTKQVSRLKTELSASLTGTATDAFNKDEVELLTKMLTKIMDPSTRKETNENQHKASVHDDYLQDDDSVKSIDILKASGSAETLRMRSTAKMNDEANKLEDKPEFITKFRYAPRRMGSKEVGVGLDCADDFDVSDITNFTYSRAHSGCDSFAVIESSIIVANESNTISPTKTIFPRPTVVDHNESLTSLNPLPTDRANSSLTDLACETLFLEDQKQRDSSSRSRPTTPPNMQNANTKNGSSQSFKTSPKSPLRRRTSFKEETMVISTRRSSGSLELDYTSLDGPMQKEGCGDILAEGMEYLSMAMLCSVYGKLREMSILGHASVKFVDIDVNSHQRISRLKEMKRRGLFEQLAKEEKKGESAQFLNFTLVCILFTQACLYLNYLRLPRHNQDCRICGPHCS